MNVNKTIGDRLDEAMRGKFESQSALARASKVPQATISRILKGGGKNGPETETIKKLAAACNVTFDWLNEGVGDAAPAVRSVHVEPAADPVVPASEVLELITAYLDADPKDRKSVMQSAKVAAQRAIRRSGRVSRNEG